MRAIVIGSQVVLFIVGITALFVVALVATTIHLVKGLAS